MLVETEVRADCWAGAKAAAPAMREATIAVFMVSVSRTSSERIYDTKMRTKVKLCRCADDSRCRWIQLKVEGEQIAKVSRSCSRQKGTQIQKKIELNFIHVGTRLAT